MKSTESGVIVLAEPGPAHRGRAAEIVSATGLFRPSEIDVAIEVFEDAVAAPGEDYYALGAFDEDGRMAGFACYGPTPGTEGTWDLYWIAVDPGEQRGGIGRSLLEACEARIAGLGGRLVVAETSSREDYTATRAFYRAMRYVTAARVREFYAVDDDLVVYTKRLTPLERANV